MKNNRYTNWFFAAAVVVAGFSMAACEDEPDKYEVAGGKPTLKYVRVPDPAAADSLLTGAYMANTICLVGENLRSVYELYFNDQKAILNTSYITDHTLMVDVPKEIPSVVTDKIYMVTKAKDTIDYDFKVLVPAPTVNSISCEFAKPGSEVTLIGDYFIDDPNVPLTITMAGNVEVTNITNITKTAVSFILPDNAPAGYINVKSIYGTGRSKFLSLIHISPDEKQLETVRYYDTANFARLLNVPGWFSWGYNDEVCPPTSMYAAYNVISSPKELHPYLETGHYWYQEQWDEWLDWIRRQLNVPM